LFFLKKIIYSFFFDTDTLKDGKRIVLVRATDGRKKISLHLQPNEVKYFQDRYTCCVEAQRSQIEKATCAADAAAPAKLLPPPPPPKQDLCQKIIICITR
jgi:hypothetical protein